MANITFTSPRMNRDVTVYAVAGDRGTVLAVAKEHRIPIPFEPLPFEGPARSMAEAGNEEVATLFKQLGGYSRLHLAQARERCAKSHVEA